MSYSFDGKVTNQKPKVVNYTSEKCHCSKCGKIIEPPESSHIKIGELFYQIQNYLTTKHFIHETKSGTAVVYCSDYCRKKHNHRFAKKEVNEKKRNDSSYRRSN